MLEKQKLILNLSKEKIRENRNQITELLSHPPPLKSLMLYPQNSVSVIRQLIM